MFVNVYTVNILFFFLPSGDRLCVRIDSDENGAGAEIYRSSQRFSRQRDLCG